MKKLIINFLLLLIFASSFAQTKGILNYKLNVKAEFGSHEVNKIIYFKDGKSIEYFVPKRVSPLSEKISENEYKYTKVLKSKGQAFIYKNIKSKELTISDFIGAKYYLISDTLDNFKWKIIKEHSKILNYDCTKALLSFRGRIYTAWFAGQIPLQLGPWKFGGLPGLIIRINDSENKFVYELTGIDFKTKFDENLLTVPAEYIEEKPITHQEFISIFNKKVADNLKMSKVVETYPNGSTGSSKITLAEKEEKF